MDCAIIRKRLLDTGEDYLNVAKMTSRVTRRDHSRSRNCSSRRFLRNVRGGEEGLPLCVPSSKCTTPRVRLPAELKPHKPHH